MTFKNNKLVIYFSKEFCLKSQTYFNCELACADPAFLWGGVHPLLPMETYRTCDFLDPHMATTSVL